MSENKTGIEVIPGVRTAFTETGLDMDVLNTWMSVYVRSINGTFDRLEPVNHYEDYFRE